MSTHPKLLERGVILSLHRESDPRGPIYRATLRLNHDHGEGLVVSGFSFGDITKALGSAVEKATSIMQLPGLNLLIPPPFNSAVAVAHHLASLAAAGKLDQLVKDPISGLMVPLLSQIKNPLIRKLAEHMSKVPALAAKANIMGDGNAVNLSRCLEGQMQGRGRGGGWRPRGGGGWGGYVYPYADVYEPVLPLASPYALGPGGIPTLQSNYRRIYGPQDGRFRFHRWPLA